MPIRILDFVFKLSWMQEGRNQMIWSSWGYFVGCNSMLHIAYDVVGTLDCY